MTISLSRLVQELEFSKAEVGRLTPVENLSEIKNVRTPTRSSEFPAAAGLVSLAEARRVELKKRALAAYEAGVLALQEKIAATVREIERVRQSMEAAPTPSAKQDPGPAPAPAPMKPRSVLDLPSRTLFGDSSSPDLDRAREALSEAAEFFNDLSSKAEKKENQKLIKDVLEQIAKLQNWLPPEPPAAVPMEPETATAAPSPVDSVPAPADDPLETAMRTHQALAKTLNFVRDRLTGQWILDRMIMDAANMVETERDQCRGAEAAAEGLQTAWLYSTLSTLLAGLVVAFLILVLADFIQSFFDTATSAALILGHLQGTPPTAPTTEPPTPDGSESPSLPE